MIAVVTAVPGEQGRSYRLPEARDYAALVLVQQRLSEVVNAGLANESSPIPDEPLPPIGTLGFRVQRYGMITWGDLFSARQKLAYHIICSKIAVLPTTDGRGRAVRALLAIVVGKLVDRCNAVVNWGAQVESPTNAIKLSALQMNWDFAESNLVSTVTASFAMSLENTLWNLRTSIIPGAPVGTVSLSDARSNGIPTDSCDLWFTDPPYYSSVPYADLSDFFFVWLKRALPNEGNFRDPYSAANALTPKDCECVEDTSKTINGSPKNKEFFEACVGEAFADGARALSPEGLGCIVFAHKTTEGWEALLAGMLKARLTIVSSWPVATERVSRMRARDSSALATSVHLVCRRRTGEIIGDWADVLRELPVRVGEWMQRLQSEGVRGADLVFACIGPALEIFSRYARVETAAGQEVLLPEYLEKVWEVVGRAALAQVLGTDDGAGSLEEDARLVALFLWTLQSTAGVNGGNDDSEYEEIGGNPDQDEDDGVGDRTARTKEKGYTLVYDVVRRFAQPLGIRLDDWERRVIETKKGSVRLLPVQERAKQLFGEDGAHAAADQLEAPGASPQLSLFPEVHAEFRPKRGRKKILVTASEDSIAQRQGATTLDRLHAAMLLQSSGRSNALRSLLQAEVDRGPEFLLLANALSALYPRDSEEKRLLDAMLLAVPR